MKNGFFILLSQRRQAVFTAERNKDKSHIGKNWGIMQKKTKKLSLLLPFSIPFIFRKKLGLFLTSGLLIKKQAPAPRKFLFLWGGVKHQALPEKTRDLGVQGAFFFFGGTFFGGGNPYGVCWGAPDFFREIVSGLTTLKFLIVF